MLSFGTTNVVVSPTVTGSVLPSSLAGVAQVISIVEVLAPESAVSVTSSPAARTLIAA